MSADARRRQRHDRLCTFLTLLLLPEHTHPVLICASRTDASAMLQQALTIAGRDKTYPIGLLGGHRFVPLERALTHGLSRFTTPVLLSVDAEEAVGGRTAPWHGPEWEEWAPGLFQRRSAVETGAAATDGAVPDAAPC